jgi:hypothetical protein
MVHPQSGGNLKALAKVLSCHRLQEITTVLYFALEE